MATPALRPDPPSTPPTALAARVGWPAATVTFIATAIAAAAVLFQAARGGSPVELFGGAFVGLLAGVLASLFVRSQVAALYEAHVREVREAVLARDRAEAANHAKDELLDAMVPQLRAPIHALLGWAALLRRGTDDEKLRRRGVESVERHVRSLMRVVDEMADVTRVARGELELHADELDVAEELRTALEPVERAARAKDVRVEADAPPMLRVRADPGRVRQMLWKLAGIALGSTPAGGRVRVTARAVEDTAVELSVTCAVAARPDPAGVALVRNLADLQGGALRVDALAEGGTSFVLTLPAAIPVEALPRLDGVKVLVVEDDPRACEVVSDVLTGRGAEVHAATHAAWRHLGPMRADVVVSDVGADGKDEYAHVVAPDSGSKRSLHKPVAPALLVRTVHELQSHS